MRLPDSTTRGTHGRDCDEAGRQRDGGLRGRAEDRRRRREQAHAQEIDGFQLVIDALKLNGIDTIFGLPGIPITDLTRQAAARRAARDLLPARAERGYAASIAGFLTQKPGICLTVSAPAFSTV